MTAAEGALVRVCAVRSSRSNDGHMFTANRAYQVLIKTKNHSSSNVIVMSHRHALLGFPFSTCDTLGIPSQPHPGGQPKNLFITPGLQISGFFTDLAYVDLPAQANFETPLPEEWIVI